jgi:hypothetical protein
MSTATNEPAASLAGATSPKPAITLRTRQRLLLILFNYIPFLNVLTIAALAWLPHHLDWPARWNWLCPIGWLLLVPPLIVRLTLAVRPLPQGDIPFASPAFFTWWFTAQWQVIFNRLPWIEELIRLVPGLYSGWLRLWGARIGKLVYWTPGLHILDRPLVDIGARVAFGVGVRINPHVIIPDSQGQLVLRLGIIHIGDDALIGGDSLLLAGCRINAGEATPGKRVFRPFTHWVDGRRVNADDRGTDA